MGSGPYSTSAVGDGGLLFATAAAGEARTPGRSRALGAALTAHVLPLAALALLALWKVEGLTAPETVRIASYIPVSLGGDPAPPGPTAPPRHEVHQHAAPATAVLRQPVQVKPVEPTTAPVPVADSVPGTSSGPVDGVGNPDPTGGGGGGPDQIGYGIAVDPAPPEDRVYRTGDAGLVPPEALDCREPAYSDLARAMRLEGEVRLEAIITRSGGVRDVSLLSGNRTLGELAARSLAACRYRPASIRSQAVESRILWTVSFRLR